MDKFGLDDAINFARENKDAAIDQVKVFWKLMGSREVEWYKKVGVIAAMVPAAIYLWNHTDLIPDNDRFGKLDNLVAIGIVGMIGSAVFEESADDNVVKRIKEEVTRERAERKGEGDPVATTKTEVDKDKPGVSKADLDL